DVELGGRATYYDWSSVDSAFLTRTNATGSLIADSSDYSVIELAAYSRFTHIENWPVLLYGHYAQNLDADSPAPSDDEDVGWGVGIEVGDKKKYVKLGGGYYHVEANFSPGQFTDSDLFDGFTNREGFLVYASRQLFANTDLNVTLFSGEEIEDDPAFDLNANPVLDPDDDDPFSSAERYRLQTDIVIKF
ncbi:MAG: putative porin, partial [Myxococcota bacterium]